jgi:hypothetical protein
MGDPGGKSLLGALPLFEVRLQRQHLAASTSVAASSWT